MFEIFFFNFDKVFACLEVLGVFSDFILDIGVRYDEGVDLIGLFRLWGLLCNGDNDEGFTWPFGIYCRESDGRGV